MTTDTYITRLEDVVKHPEMMPDLSSIRGDIACLLAAHREVLKNISILEGNENVPQWRKSLDRIKKERIVGGLREKLKEAEHTYECAKRE